MFTEVFYFYLLFFLLLGVSIGVIVAPRMFLSLASFFVMICVSSLLYLTLNATYIAVFQFILCGLILSAYIFLLLKKIGRLNLKLKLVPVSKVIFGILFTLLLGFLTCLFVNEEFSHSLYSIFNYITEKSSDVVNLGAHMFPLHLVVILFLVAVVVIRVFLSNQSEDVQ